MGAAFLKFLPKTILITLFIGLLSSLLFGSFQLYVNGLEFNFNNLTNFNYFIGGISSFFQICIIISISVLAFFYIIEDRQDLSIEPVTDENKSVAYNSSISEKNNSPKIQCNSFDINEIITDAARKISSRILDKDIEILIHVQPDIPNNLIGDARRLHHILTNLISNAIKFTEAGHILVSVTSERNINNNWQLQFSVEDTGVGIGQHDLAEITTAFRFLNGEAVRGQQTNCLGLAITARLVSLMGGAIGVHTNEGKGSRFWFNIEMPGASSPSQISNLKPFEDVPILIISDNKVSERFIEQQLSYWGAEYITCNTEHETLSFLMACDAHKYPIEMIIFDYMPSVNDTNMISAIRNMATYNKTPIVLLSSINYSTPQNSFSCEGLHSVLHKPFSRTELFNAMASAIAPITEDDRIAIEAARQIANLDKNNTTKIEYKSCLMGGGRETKLRLIKNNLKAA